MRRIAYRMHGMIRTILAHHTGCGSVNAVRFSAALRIAQRNVALWHHENVRILHVNS